MNCYIIATAEKSLQWKTKNISERLGYSILKYNIYLEYGIHSVMRIIFENTISLHSNSSFYINFITYWSFCSFKERHMDANFVRWYIFLWRHRNEYFLIWKINYCWRLLVFPWDNQTYISTTLNKAQNTDGYHYWYVILVSVYAYLENISSSFLYLNWCNALIKNYLLHFKHFILKNTAALVYGSWL